MSLQVETGRDAAGRHEIRLVGILDLASREAVVAAGRSALDQDAQSPVVLDLAGVTFIDSTGFRALLTVSNLASATGTKLVLKSPSRRIVRLLEIIGLIDTWTIES